MGVLMEYQKLAARESEADQRLAQLAAGIRDGAESALEELVRALQGAYALDFRSALLTVLCQAQATFRWQQREGRARQEQIANFVFRLTRGAMRTFGTSAQIAAQAILQAATTVVAILAVAIPIIVSILTFGAAGSGIQNVLAAVCTAGETVIRTALTTAFAAGFSTAAVVAAGSDFLQRRGETWAVTVVDAWRNAPVRPGLSSLVRALREVPGLTADRLADVLVRWLCGGAAVVGAGDVAIALNSVFGRDPVGGFVHAVRGVLGLSAEAIAGLIKDKFGLDLGGIANALVAEFGRDPNLIARAFKAVRAGAHDAAVALRNAGCSAAETGRALKDEFALGRDQVTTELTNAGFGASEVAQAVSSLFQAAGSAVQSFVQGLG
jgi:hypothetical protein